MGCAKILFTLALSAAAAVAALLLLYRRRPRKGNPHEARIRVSVPEELQLTWADAFGMAGQEAALRRMVMNPMRVARFASLRLSNPARFVLLSGPSGCGKSLLAEAMAQELGSSLVLLEMPREEEEEGCFSGFLSAAVSVANDSQPCVVLVRHLEDLPQLSAKLLELLLRCIDVALPHAVVVGTTRDRPSLGLSLLSCFPTKLEVSLPDERTRLEVLETILGDLPSEGVDLPRAAKEAEGLSVGDFYEVHRWACWCALRDALPDDPIGDEEAASVSFTLLQRHIREAVQQVKRMKLVDSEDWPLQMYM